METNNKQSVILDMRLATTVPTPTFIQNDTNILEFVIKDNGAVADLSDVDNITVNFQRPDGVITTRSLTATENTIKYDIGTEEMGAPGYGELTLQFFKKGTRLSSKRLKVYFAKSLGASFEKSKGMPLLQEFFVEVEDVAQTTMDAANFAMEKGNDAEQAAANAIHEASNLAQIKSATETATSNANTAKTNADQATTNANTKANFAQTQGDYAKTQADRAKTETDRLVGTDVSVLDNKINQTMSQLVETVKKVNGVTPDVNGNVVVSSGSDANTTPNRFGYSAKKEMVEHWQAGHGWTKQSPAGSTIADDTVNFRTGKQAIRLDATTITCFADKSINSNVIDKGIEVDVYIPDVSTIESVDILLSPTTGFTNYFAESVLGRELRNGWNTIGLIPRKFNRLGSTPPTIDQLANIQRWRIKVVPVPGKSTVAIFDRIQLVPNPFSRAKVVLRFDDGHDTVYKEAKPIMDKYGLRGVAYVITAQHDDKTSNRMTMQQLHTLQDLGWDIASHTVNHTYLLDDKPSPQELTHQLLDSKKWLLENGFYRGADHLATPGGQFNPAILDEIKKYYSTHSTVMDGYEYYPPADVHRLKIQNVINSTTVAQVQTWIDFAVQNKSLLILTFHYFANPATAETQVLPSNFQLMMDYLATTNVDVVTMSDLANYNAPI
ncbi:polysaccharide deacetylase family protein [Bacillus cihuensis]|uniref:polysaccharide deacetylase family protein n=1 Tax=Bacillus cihuensis TaxID=1208599 RepID=UPI0003FC0A79|nr:polysaccharide deacetylase family protein [Bacillus cihuensis]